ncbi:MAG: hypothetical protein AUJ72_04950 [Candidatus Omnitrophica bacterium CG1_02_46_14]|nr:MAG: hypothetical protein AUJ72_04950 [Candidatus Omnitrophica bacterium CG1_02_46_14]
MARNKKTQNCCWCGKNLNPGDGNLFYVDEEDENLGLGPMGATGWLVSCLDKKTCEARRQAHKESIQKAREEREAFNTLEKRLFRDDEGRKPGWPFGGQMQWPKGVEYEREGEGHNIYGGGYCYIDTESVIWLIQNNGMDGDMWDLNNISTGGAGAIGLVFDRTPERLEFLGRLINVTEKRKRDKKESDRLEAEKLEIWKKAIDASVKRTGGWEVMEKILKDSKQKFFCPKEIHKTIYSHNFTISEAKLICGI